MLAYSICPLKAANVDETYGSLGDLAVWIKRKKEETEPLARHGWNACSGGLTPPRFALLLFALFCPLFLAKISATGMIDAFYGLVASLDFPWLVCVFLGFYFPYFPPWISKETKGNQRTPKAKWYDLRTDFCALVVSFGFLPQLKGGHVEYSQTPVKEHTLVLIL